MNIAVNKSVFSANPKLKVAFIIVKGFDNKKKLKEAKHLLSETETVIRLTFNKDSFKTHHLTKPWDVAREEFGKSAKHYHTSVEKLLKDVLKKKKIQTTDTLTNLLRYLALKTIIPFGADDFDKIEGNLIFSAASGKERSKVLKKLGRGEIYYGDSKDILGAKLDYWKNSKTSLTSKSTNALIHFEALPPITPKKLKEIVQEAAELIGIFCGGKTKVVILSKSKNSFRV